MANAAFNKKKAFCTSKLGRSLRNKAVKCYIWSTALCDAETGTLRKVIRNTWKVLQCGAGQGWRRYVAQLV
jgi:hypothetical protein